MGPQLLLRCLYTSAVVGGLRVFIVIIVFLIELNIIFAVSFGSFSVHYPHRQPSASAAAVASASAAVAAAAAAAAAAARLTAFPSCVFHLSCFCFNLNASQL